MEEVLYHRGMCGVALLPEELQGSKEGPRAHLPSMRVGPLVDQQWQISVRLHPLRKHVVDHGLRGGPHRQGLFQVLAPACSRNELGIMPNSSYGHHHDEHTSFCLQSGQRPSLFICNVVLLLPGIMTILLSCAILCRFRVCSGASRKDPMIGACCL